MLSLCRHSVGGLFCTLHLSQTEIAELPYQTAGPPIDVMLFYRSTHALHPIDHLDNFHLECFRNCIRGRLNVIRINDDCVSQIPSGSCESTQDQDSSLILPGSDVLLGHQVHSVMQGGDHAKMSRAIVATDFLMRVLTVQKDNRSPFAAFETIVDPVGLCLHFHLEIGISLNTTACRSAYLNEGKLALIPGIFFQKRFDCLEPFDDSLGIVHAIDTHANVGCFDAEFCDQRAALLFSACLVGIGRYLAGKLHADREGTYGGPVIV